MSLLWTLSLKIGYLKTTLTYTLTNQMKIDNLISQLIFCMTCIPSTFCWQPLKNWEILSTIYEATGALPSVPLKVRWWATIYGKRIRGTTSFLYLMNMRVFVGYIWVICPKKWNNSAETLNVFQWNYLLCYTYIRDHKLLPIPFWHTRSLRLLIRVNWNCLLKCNHQQQAVCRELFCA